MNEISSFKPLFQTGAQPAHGNACMGWLTIKACGGGRSSKADKRLYFPPCSVKPTTGCKKFVLKK